MKRRVDFLAGEVAAMRAFLLVLMKTHPDPRRLMADFDRARAIQEAASVPTTVSDEYLAGQEETADQIAEYIQGLCGGKRP